MAHGILEVGKNGSVLKDTKNTVATENHRQERSLAAVANIAFKVGDAFVSVAGFVDSIYNLINKQDDKMEIDPDKLVAAVGDRVVEVAENLYSKIHLREQLADVDEVKNRIQSVLTDLEFYLISQENEKEQYMAEFLTQSPGMIRHLRSLPELFHRNLAGGSNPILGAISAETRCNMTALHTFKQFFSELLNNGILAEMTYKRLRYNTSLDLETKYWDKQLKRVKRSFHHQERSCINQLRTLAMEDLTALHDIDDLFNSNRERYIWLYSDVIFLHGTDERLYTEGSDENLLYVQTQGIKKYAFFVDKVMNNTSIKCISIISRQDHEEPSIRISRGSPAYPPSVVLDNWSKQLVTTLVYSSDNSCRAQTQVIGAPTAAAQERLFGNLAWWITIMTAMFIQF